MYRSNDLLAVGGIRKVEHYYTGPLTSTLADGMARCSPAAPLMINITKLYTKPGEFTLVYKLLLTPL